MSHTPGPWKRSHDNEFSIYARSNNLQIANVESHAAVRGQEGTALFMEAQCNARLIAAAPDLLEACRMMLTEFDDTYDGGALSLEYAAAIAAMRNAVAKAEDKQ